MNSYVGQLQDELDVPKTGPIFTVVIPAYNVEDYLEEAVQSILDQDFDVDGNIEIVIINDGSTDQTPHLVDQLAARYPTIIRAFHQENRGVSQARNRGMSLARGKYLGFLDSDDKYSKNTFSNVYRFFEDHESEIDAIGIPLEFFGDKTGQHILNHKFHDGTRVINVEKNWDLIQGSLSASFVKKRPLKNMGYI